MKKIMLGLTCLLLLMVAACTPFTEVQSMPESSATNRAAAGSSIVLIEAETMSLGGSYTGVIDSPFDGIALYGGSDYGECSVEFPTVPGEYRLALYGASNNNNTAVVELYVDDKAMGKLYFDGISRAKSELDFSIEEGSAGTKTLKLTAESDNGSWDAYLDSLELIFTGIPPEPPAAPVPPTIPAWDSRQYRNLFVEWGKTEAEVNARVNAIIDQLFYGSDDERIYYESGSDMAYIYTADTDDVRSEGMSYGMMMCVQLGMQEEFNRLWKFAQTHMQHHEGDRLGYFSWQVRTDGTVIDSNPAPDGEEYFAISLLMASNLWGNGSGIYDYQAEANYILDHMINHQEMAGLESWNGVTSMIDAEEKQIVFVPYGNAATYTDPSYHLPHFYELFARWADNNNQLWLEIADESRQLFRDATHPSTGLAPDYSNFDGSPTGGTHEHFRYDAWRVAMNITLDSVWWNVDPWQRNSWNPTFLDFFFNQGVSSFKNQFAIDGSQAEGDHSPGLVAMNATAALISSDQKAWDFVEEFWNTNPTTGTYRYYDGCLYLFGLLNVSGRYRIIGPDTELPDYPDDPVNPEDPVLSHNANLSGLSLSTGNLSPGFSAQVYSYSVDLDHSVTSLSIAASADDPAAQVQGSGTLSLSVGLNTHLIVVTAEDGYTQVSYQLNINRAEADLPEEPVDPDQMPFSGLISIPGTLEAEDYDLGGQGIAYSDNEEDNQGGDYRNDGVDLQSCSQGGYNVGWIADGEWLEYSVNVAETSAYTIDLHLASASNGGALRLVMDQQDISGLVSFQATGGWQNWIVISLENVNLSAGNHTLRIEMEDSNFNLDKCVFTLEETEDPVDPEDPPVEPEDPPSGNLDAFSLIEAESFVDSQGITLVSDNNGTVVEFSGTQSWIALDVDFSSEPQGIELTAMTLSWGEKLSFYVDSPDGQNFSTVYLNGGGIWALNNNTCWPRPTGVHRIYIVASQAGTRLDNLKFRK